MTLITRLSRLFRADIHAVLDNIEEPELLLRQAIREMEDDLLRQEQAVRLAKHEQGEFSARREQLETRLSEIEGELDLCFESGKDDLARGLVKRKLETRGFLRQLVARQEKEGASVVRKETQLAENRTTLDALRQKAELIDIRASANEYPDGFGAAARGSREPIVTADEVEVAFLREKQARTSS